jgi:hypothetical protein
MADRKTSLSCAAVAVLVIVVPVAFFLWLAHSLETEPVEGWQEGPSVSRTPPAVHFTPYPTAEP